MKINQITPIRYGQSEETDFLPEEEIVIPCLLYTSDAADE